MSFKKKIRLIVFSLLGSLFVGMLGIQSQSAYTNAKAQATALSEEMAFSLGIALAPYVTSNDTVSMQRLLDRILVQGSFAKISVLDRQGVTLVEGSGKFLERRVPQWFVNVVPLTMPVGAIQHSLQGGDTFNVSIQAHAGRIYTMLWETIVGSLWWLLLLVVVAQLWVRSVVNAVVLPLAQVEDLLYEIIVGRFNTIKEKPKYQEIQSVVTAINTMAGKVEAMVAEQSLIVDKLRDEVYTDVVTGLSNRRAFEIRLESIIGDEEAAPYGALLLIRVDDLKTYNDKHGIEAGDELLAAVAKNVRQLFSDTDNVLKARVGGADIAIFVPGADLNEVKVESEALSSKLSKIPYRGEKRILSHVGISVYLDKKDISHLWSNADAALRAAQEKGPYSWAWSSIDDGAIKNWSYSQDEWRKLIDKILKQRKVVLVNQPVIAAKDDQVLHYEIFVRLEDDKGDLIPAGVFMPVVEKLGLAPILDRIVLENVMSRWEKDGDSTIQYAVNLSPASLIDSAFLEWLYGTVLVSPQLAQGLIIEISEFGLQSHVDAVKTLIQRLKVLNVGTSLDHFGIGFATVGYLRSLGVDYVKLDGSYIRDITTNSDNKNIVKVLSEVSSGIDVMIIAESVESEADWTTVKSLGLDGGRGYWLSKPQILDDTSPRYVTSKVARGAHLHVIK